MFNIINFRSSKDSRWSKASKCKKMIKRARRTLRQLKNKRQVIAKQLCIDLLQLTGNDSEEIAIRRVEQLIQDHERLVAAYELLDKFLVFILTKLSYIRKNKDCPPDINEAVSSLIFASARCGNFPELYAIRKLFGHRYGQDFATAAVELFPGNLVNLKLIENLSVMTMFDYEKCMVVDEIARDNCFQSEVNDCEWNQLEKLESDAEINYSVAESIIINPSEVEEIESDDSFDSSSISKKSDTFFLPDSISTETSGLVSNVHGEIVEYCVDEIEEHQRFVSKDGYSQEQPCKGSSTQKYTKRRDFNLDFCECSLDQPCYCCIYYDQECCYSRALTMTSQSPENCRDNLLRTSKQPKHVHPRLPEFEDIVTFFTTLKRQILHC